MSLIVALSALLTSCATNPVTGDREFMLLSEKQEVAMGQQSDPEIVQFFGVYEDKKLQKFIQQKGKEMAAISHRPELNYEFKVVDSPVINAFAVPGGYVYFTRGIMAHFNNEAEFAGVLGHEIGHITARHSAKSYSNNMLAQVGLVAGMVIAPELAQFADAAQQGLGLLFLQFSRKHETQSDKLGVEYSTKIGYDANEMAGFFTTLDRIREDAGAGETPTFLSTHPDPADREQKVKKLADKWQAKVNKPLETGRDSYLKMIDGMIYGKDPKQGYLENSVFYHPVLKFTFDTPNGWTFQNTPSQIQMAPKDGGAVMMLRLSQGNSLEEAATSTMENNQLNVVESLKVDVNGLNAIAVVADQESQEGNIRTLSYFIQHGGNIYNIMGVSAKQNFDKFSRTFTNTMGSFDNLTDRSKINIKPVTLEIEKAPQNGTLSQNFKQLNVAQSRQNELAILNGMQLDTRIEKGTLIKTLSRY